MATYIINQSPDCAPYLVGDTYLGNLITEVEDLGFYSEPSPHTGDRKFQITTASSDLEEAKEWASQLWSEMCSYEAFSIEDFIAQLEGHFTNEVLSQIKELYN